MKRHRTQVSGTRARVRAGEYAPGPLLSAGTHRERLRAREAALVPHDVRRLPPAEVFHEPSCEIQRRTAASRSPTSDRSTNAAGRSDSTAPVDEHTAPKTIPPANGAARFRLQARASPS